MNQVIDAFIQVKFNTKSDVNVYDIENIDQLIVIICRTKNELERQNNSKKFPEIVVDNVLFLLNFIEKCSKCFKLVSLSPSDLNICCIRMAFGLVFGILLE